mgnify:CR=1 FL=1
MKRTFLALALLLPFPAGATPWEWGLPAHFPPPPVPADNPMSVEKVELGRRLFHDTRLSGNGSTSCASCHFQSLAFSDGRPVSAGATGQTTHRNAPGLVNLAWMASYTWANPALTSLERQAEVPLFGDDPVEMGVTDANRGEILARLADDEEYPALFATAFPAMARPITFDSVVKALAAFQRSLVGARSRHDRFLTGEAVPTDSERRGMALFSSPASGCTQCHGGVLFTDHAAGRAVFHDATVHGITDSIHPNRGLFELTGAASDLNRFRAPSLREITLTAPYMHDGRYPDLETVLTHYARRSFSTAERNDLIAFLATLRSPRHDRIGLLAGE